MMWERDIYVTLLQNHIEKENLKRQQQEGVRSMDEEQPKENTLNNFFGPFNQ